jgi:hypothetical protein
VLTPNTFAAGSEHEQLVTAVSNMAMSQTPIVFASRFLLTTGMVRGGQGIVVFARGDDGGMRQFAIKCAPIYMGIHLRETACFVVHDSAGIPSILRASAGESTVSVSFAT